MATVVEWLRRSDKERKRALLEVPEPVNKFPDLVHSIVRPLKLLCSTMGKRRTSGPWPAPIASSIHRYQAVDRDVLWNTVSGDLPGLIAELGRILGESE